MLATISNFAFFLADANGASETTSGTTPTQPQGGGSLFGGGSSMLIIWVLIIAGMYFLMIAPQRKKQKAMQKMLSEMEAGDEVMTSSGIFGTIVNKKEDRFTLRIAEGVKIEIHKSAVQTVLKKGGQDVKA